MNRELAVKVANAVLYEGYRLYPYRPSAMKNRQRWSFGILYPPAYHEVAAGTERSQMHSECLVRVTGNPVLQVQLRFLHLVTHEVAERAIESRDEGVERSVEIEVPLSEILNETSNQSSNEHVNQTWVPRSSRLLSGAGQVASNARTAPPLRQAQGRLWPRDGQNGAPQVQGFPFAASTETEPVRDNSGNDVGEIRRTQQGITGSIAVAASQLRDDVVKLALDVTNTSSLADGSLNRDCALLTSLLSAHTILSITGGEFISLLDPPDDLQQEVSACRNVGNFPVLVGAEGEHDMMLCSPIVLYDYPQIAPESAGDFFDGTEMDEMLTLRIMTLTDEEKNAMLTADDRVRNLLQRTEAGAREQLARTHGTIRSMRQVNES